MSEIESVGVLGSGAWGTALAQVCARAGRRVVLWSNEPEVAEAINREHANPSFLPGVKLDPSIRATTDMAALKGFDLILAVPPAQHMRSVLTAFAPFSHPGQPVTLCAKGVEQGSLKLMTDVLAETLPQVQPSVLSGPSFAASAPIRSMPK